MALLAWILALQTARAVPVPTVVGTCPGFVEVQISGGTARGPYLVLRGARPGSSPVPSGRCAGASLAVDAEGLAVVGRGRFDVYGAASQPVSVTPLDCFSVLSVFDPVTCESSLALPVAGGDFGVVAFPSEGSAVWPASGGEYLLADDLFLGDAGDVVEERFVTPYVSLQRIALSATVFDATNLFCGAITPYRWEVLLNDVVVGEVTLPAGGSLGPVDVNFETHLGKFPLPGGEVVVALRAVDDLCLGGGGWQWLPGGVLALSP